MSRPSSAREGSRRSGRGSPFQTLRALIAISRPGNVVLTALAVYIGGISAYSPSDIIPAAIAAACIAAGGYVINDVFDLDIDRVNRPDRPLPSGALSPAVATLWSVLLTVCGIGVSFELPRLSTVIAISASAMLFLYAIRLKRTVFVGHAVVAGLSGLAFVFGGAVGAHPGMSLVPAVMAFGFHLGREMLKAAADEEGDRLAGANTMAVKWGIHITGRVASIPLFTIVFISPLPTIFGWFGIRYLVSVLLTVDAVLIYVGVMALRRIDSKRAARLAGILKYDMLAGLIAVWWDRWAL